MEDRIQRERHRGLQLEADRLDGPGDLGPGPMLVQTKTVGTYPTAAGRYFAVTTVDPGGTEGEGNAGSYTVGTDTFYALNIGIAIPPSGTKLLAHPVGGRWIFDYNG